MGLLDFAAAFGLALSLLTIGFLVGGGVEWLVGRDDDA